MKNTTLLKGLGILLIITHNYAHWLPQCVDENEYTFSPARVMQLADYLWEGGPHVLLNLFSHYGHYGVAIFLFLSGYGLVRKYEQNPNLKSESWWRFLLRHALKLWKLMLPAVLIFVILQMALGSWNRPLVRLIPLLGFYSNLQPNRDLLLGPWWWFGLMMQFYLLWRLIIYKRKKWVLYTLMALCLIAQIAIAWLEFGALAEKDTLTSFLHYNFPPSMLAFGLGVAHARYGLKWLEAWWSPIIGAAIIILGSFNAGIWCISSAGAIMLALSFTKLSGREAKLSGVATKLSGSDVKPSYADASQSNTDTKQSASDANSLGTDTTKKVPPILDGTDGEPYANVVYFNVHTVLHFLGTVSAWLFALHPIVRDYCIPLARRGSDMWLYVSVAIYLCVSIVAAWVFTSLTNKKTRTTTQ